MGIVFEKTVRILHRGYKLTLSPFVGQSCRYLPTCSDYTRDALITHGLLRGSWLGVVRICKCRPGGGSGIDNVPAKVAKDK